jgi:hypothetical protein
MQVLLSILIFCGAGALSDNFERSSPLNLKTVIWKNKKFTIDKYLCQPSTAGTQRCFYKPVDSFPGFR